jgi:short-subunit dehydrogenase
VTYFSNKCAAITGAGDGIGRELAIQLNAQGCDLFLCDISEQRLAETVSLLKTSNGVIQSARVDCGVQAQIDEWADSISQQRSCIDALFNNAGVAYSAPFEDSTDANYQWLMNINFWGVVWSSRAFMPLLKKAPVGHLVNISSIFGMVGINTQSAYNASKFAVRGFTESLQAEYRGSHIKVSCVHPGGISTNIARRARTNGSSVPSSEEERDAQFRRLAKTSPGTAAQVILKGAAKGKPRILIGLDAWFVYLLTFLMPTSYHIITGRLPTGDGEA